MLYLVSLFYVRLDYFGKFIYVRLDYFGKLLIYVDVGSLDYVN